MRSAILSFAFLILMNSGLAGQTRVNLSHSEPVQNRSWKPVSDQNSGIRAEPKYKSRSFLRKAGVASLEIFGLEAFTSTILILLPTSITNWEEQYWLYFGRNFKRAYTSPPVWDKDLWVVNYGGHPYEGAIYFNSLRSQDCSFLASAGFNIFHTLLWEYFTEAIMEQPSAQDLIVTPVTGIALGELFHFLTKKMRRGGFTKGEKVLVTLINPYYVLNNGYR